MLVLGDVQNVRTVPEGLQVGHQFHMALAGVGVQFQDVVAAQRATCLTDSRVMGKLKGVLSVELEHVPLVQAEHVHDLLERLYGGHLSP